MSKLIALLLCAILLSATGCAGTRTSDWGPNLLTSLTLGALGNWNTDAPDGDWQGQQRMLEDRLAGVDGEDEFHRWE